MLHFKLWSWYCGMSYYTSPYCVSIPYGSWFKSWLLYTGKSPRVAQLPVPAPHGRPEAHVSALGAALPWLLTFKEWRDVFLFVSPLFVNSAFQIKLNCKNNKKRMRLRARGFKISSETTLIQLWCCNLNPTSGQRYSLEIYFWNFQWKIFKNFF